MTTYSGGGGGGDAASPVDRSVRECLSLSAADRVASRAMDSDEDALRTFKNAIFNTGVSRGRGYVHSVPSDQTCWERNASRQRP
jgi:hypothetical protein